MLTCLTCAGDPGSARPEPPDARLLLVRAAASWPPAARARDLRKGMVVQVPEVGFPVEVTGDVPVVAAPEEIDITSAESLRTVLLEAAARGHGTFVVDMSRTRFCDSSGLHALEAAHRRARAEGGEVRLVIPDAAVLRVFAITGMDQVIPNFASLDEALVPAPEDRFVAGTRAERSTDAEFSPVPSR